MQEFLLYRVSGEITKGNLVFMKNISGEISKEIFSVFLFLRNRSFGVPDVCKYFFVFQESLKTLPKPFWLKKTQKQFFGFSKCSNLKSTRYVGFVSKRLRIHPRFSRTFVIKGKIGIHYRQNDIILKIVLIFCSRLIFFCWISKICIIFYAIFIHIRVSSNNGIFCYLYVLLYATSQSNKAKFSDFNISTKLYSYSISD